ESQRSRVAALHAAQVARERGTSLLVLMALPMPVSELSWYPELSPDAEGIAERRRQELQEVLEQDIAWIRAQVPAIEVAGEGRAGGRAPAAAAGSDGPAARSCTRRRGR